MDNILTITGAGIVTVEASQAGDDVNYSAAMPVEQSFTVNKAQLTVTADNQVRVFGQANPAFTATITGFLNGETLADSGISGTPALSSNATAASPVGTYAITAAQGTLESANYDFVTFAAGTLKVNKAATTVTLKTSVTSAAVGQQITFTATVAAASPGTGIPGGTVTFKDGATVLGTGTLSNGVATFKTTTLAVGTHSITAVYAGNSNFTTKTSAALTQAVVQSSKTTLQSSLASSTFGQSVTLTATVCASNRDWHPDRYRDLHGWSRDAGDGHPQRRQGHPDYRVAGCRHPYHHRCFCGQRHVWEQHLGLFDPDRQAGNDHDGPHLVRQHRPAWPDDHLDGQDQRCRSGCRGAQRDGHLQGRSDRAGNGHPD